MTTGEQPPSITQRNLDHNEGEEPEDTVEDDVDDLKMKITVKLRGEVVG